jgi:ABC-type sulfate transport system permease subunit
MLVTAAVLVALPFGWGLGVFVAYLVAGRNFGQLPALTVLLGLVASIAFAVSPILTPGKRLTIMLVGTGVFLILGSML